jgi:hypothetical protein
MATRAPTSSLNELGLNERERAEIVDILFREVRQASSPHNYELTRADIDLCVQWAVEDLVKGIVKIVRRKTWFWRRRVPLEVLREANAKIQKGTLVQARQAIAILMSMREALGPKPELNLARLKKLFQQKA